MRRPSLLSVVAAMALATIGCTEQGTSGARGEETSSAVGVAASSAASALPASAPAAALGLTEEQYGDVVRCALPELARPAPELLGVSEGRVADAVDDRTVRVVGRDGACARQEPVDHRAPVEQGRVNLVVEDGVVIWAGRY